MKPKICKQCQKPFPPRNSLQSLCSPRCAIKKLKDKPKTRLRKLKKILEDEVLRRKADKKIQAKYTKGLCESCGLKPADCAHHYIFKSQSNYLRYNSKNLIPICSECHLRHHKSGDSEIMSRVIAKRGIDWERGLQSQRRTPCKLTVPYLKKVLADLEKED